MKQSHKEDEGRTQDLFHSQAVEKLKELVDHHSTCLFTTNLSNMPLTTRPMSVQKVSDDGSLWFLSAVESNKNSEIDADAKVQLFFSNASDNEFFTVFGDATISTDRQKIEELWNPIAKAWFNEGKDDPRITVIKIVPRDGFYWDTKNGKIISMVKILTSAIAGKTLSEGVEGHLKV